MRKATMFTIEQHEVMATDRYSYFAMKMMPTFDDYISAGPDVLVTTDSQRIDVPVHHVRKIEEGQQTDNYIAMSPELQEILEAPFQSQIMELKREVIRAEDLVTMYKHTLRAYQDAIYEYNNLPWYKRLFTHCPSGLSRL